MVDEFTPHPNFLFRYVPTPYSSHLYLVLGNSLFPPCLHTDILCHACNVGYTVKTSITETRKQPARVSGRFNANNSRFAGSDAFKDMQHEVSMAVTILIVLFWAMIPCGLVAIYQYFTKRQNGNEQRQQIPPRLGPIYKIRGITLYGAFVRFWRVKHLAELAEGHTMYGVFCFARQSRLLPCRCCQQQLTHYCQVSSVSVMSRGLLHRYIRNRILRRKDGKCGRLF
jgi:hypothetical protein